MGRYIGSNFVTEEAVQILHFIITPFGEEKFVTSNFLEGGV